MSAKNNKANRIELGKVATVFIAFGLLSLLTSRIYSTKTEQVINTSFYPLGNGTFAELGPFNVKKYNQIYNINIEAALFAQSWSYIEGQALNDNKQYLFSFGKELSYYSGSDADGAWEEVEDNYLVKVNFVKPGVYYLKFSAESNHPPSDIEIKIVKENYNSMPHLWFGIFTLIIGIVLNEVKNHTIRDVLKELRS